MNGRYLLALLALGALAPLLILQGLHLRRTALRLPPARGERRGSEPGTEPGLNLVVLGESTAAGVGVERQRDALAGQLAQALAARLQRAVHWEAAGLNGLTAARAAQTLLPWVQMGEAEIVVVALGVNDTLALRSPRRWLADLGALTGALRSRFQPRLVAISAVPPVGRFDAIPQPLRAVFGLVAGSLDHATRRWQRGQTDLVYVPLASVLPEDVRLLGRDGFHPSAEGYALWGERLAAKIVDHL